MFLRFSDENYMGIDWYVNQLKSEYPKLSDYEALKLAVEYQRNEILIAGLQVSGGNLLPSAIEMIAIQLGAKPINMP